MHPSLIFALLNLPFCWAAIYDSFADLPQHHKFDFVVIGDPEACSTTPSRSSTSSSGVPGRWYTVTSAGLNNRVLAWPRGRILGGSTSINGMGYVRGSRDDYDRYAAVSRDPGWGWDAIQPYFRKNEQWTPPTDGHNQTGMFNPIFHGFHGVYRNQQHNRVAGVLKELPEEFPYNEDANSGSPLGVSWVQSTIKHGKRSSSFTSYLGPEFIGRPNLHVLINAQATRLIQTGPGAFQKVEFASSREGPRITVTATKEVIISACSIETPKLLMNSGIGDPQYLSSVGIKPLVSIPDVGKNLSVHLAVNLIYSVNSTQTFDEIIRNETFRDGLLAEWIKTNGTGPLGISYTSHNIFTRLPKDSPIFENNTDPSAGPSSAHLQGTTQNGDISLTAEGNYFSLPATLLTPTSRGSVLLKSLDPFDGPLIDVGSLNTEFDVFARREAVKMTHRFIQAKAWEGYILQPFSNLSLGATDEEIETFIHANAAPNYHVVSTASFSPKGAGWGVVDPDFHVKNIQHLRVVDASVLPYLPCGFTMNTTYMVAERASDMIKTSWK